MEFLPPVALTRMLVHELLVMEIIWGVNRISSSSPSTSSSATSDPLAIGLVLTENSVLGVNFINILREDALRSQNRKKDSDNLIEFLCFWNLSV